MPTLFLQVHATSATLAAQANTGPVCISATTAIIPTIAFAKPPTTPTTHHDQYNKSLKLGRRLQCYSHSSFPASLSRLLIDLFAEACQELDSAKAIAETEGAPSVLVRCLAFGFSCREILVCFGLWA